MRHYLAPWTLAALVAVVLFQTHAAAHFPWLIRNGESKAQLFFGEGLNDRTYKLPPAIAKAEICRSDEKTQAIKLTTTAIENDEFVGLTSSESVPVSNVLSSHMTYGVFRGSKLEYTALSYGELAKDAGSVVLPSELILQAKLYKTESGLSVLVTWEGKPLAEAKVSMFDAKAVQTAEVPTDASGVASFTNEQIHAGLNAIRVGHTVSKEGKLGDTAYSGEMHYLTATFPAPQSAESLTFGELPFPITSFGAATDGQALYVFGGHTGDAHSYSFEEQSDKLLRLDLKAPQHQWQELATGNRVQGTALVAYRSELIVIGGFQAKNKKGEPKDLHSLADVRSFHKESKTWSELPALPEPRSSHDAAMIGSTVYVVGGWNMSGDSDTVWHKTAWKMDLSKTDRQWEAFPAPPFERRAIATIEHRGQLVVIGGMNQDGGPTKAVAVFDPKQIHGQRFPKFLATNRWRVLEYPVGVWMAD